jgi:5-methylthioadenosine/S-adenosylhomocysteine deaminase
MTTKHIKDLTIVTLNKDDAIYHDADLVVQDSQITHIGKTPDNFEADEIVDGRGCVAMPGLHNAHGHSAMSLLRGWAETGYTDLAGWLNKVWQFESLITPEDVYWGNALAVAEMIRGGTVGFSDMYFNMDQVVRVVQKSGIKAALSWVFFDADSDAYESGFERTIAWIKEVEAERYDRIRTYLAPHTTYTVSEESLRHTVDIAHDLENGIHIHLAESEDEVQQMLANENLRPVQYADQLGVFDVPGGCLSAHTLHVDQDEIEILASKGVHVAHCPLTYFRLGYRGFPSLKPILKAGVQVSLGTDGPASSPLLDMFDMVRQTVFLSRFIEGSPSMFTGDQVLRMATQNGAKALGFPDSGVIEVGAPADLIILNMDVPHLRPTHDLIANLTFSARGSDVTDVMVDGQWLMRKRELLTLDEERIIYEVERRAKRLASAVASS